MTISTELQKLHQDSPLVELWTLYGSDAGGSDYSFTPHFAEGGTCAYGGTTYTSMPIMGEGWEAAANGTQPRPTVTLSNVNKAIFSAVVTLGDLVGCRVKMIRTFAKFLDGEPGADSTAHMPAEQYVIEQRLFLDRDFIKFQLSSPLDRFGTMLPREQITRSRFPGVGRQRGGW